MALSFSLYLSVSLSIRLSFSPPLFSVSHPPESSSARPRPIHNRSSRPAVLAVSDHGSGAVSSAGAYRVVIAVRVSRQSVRVPVVLRVYRSNVPPIPIASFVHSYFPKTDSKTFFFFFIIIRIFRPNAAVWWIARWLIHSPRTVLKNRKLAKNTLIFRRFLL